MANKKPTDITTLQQKVKVLAKLYDSGCKTEKALQSLSIESILGIPNIPYRHEQKPRLKRKLLKQMTVTATSYKRKRKSHAPICILLFHTKLLMKWQTNTVLIKNNRHI